MQLRELSLGRSIHDNAVSTLAFPAIFFRTRGANTVGESEADVFTLQVTAISCPVCRHDKTKVVETTPLFRELPNVECRVTKVKFATVYTRRCLSVRCGHEFRQEVAEPMDVSQVIGG
jgi:hypothetical protein